MNPFATLFLNRKPQPQDQRDFVVGPGVVDPTDLLFGKESDTFQPAVYGNYLATSNAVYACAMLRASMLASLPLELFKVDAEGERELVMSGALWTLLQKVNPFWTLSRLIRMSELSFSLWGEAFWALERGERGNQPPREMWWVRPDRMRVVPDPVNYIRGFIYKPDNTANEIPFLPSEVIWMPYPNPIDEYEGLSPLAAARLAADTASDAMKSNRNLFTQGMNPGGVVMPGADNEQWSPEQANDLERLLDKRFKGVDKAHRWAVLRTQMKLDAMSITPKDAEFINLLNWTLEDVARAYGVPLELIGGRRTYENVPAAERAMWIRTLRPEANFISEELTEKLLPMFPNEADLAEFDLSGVEVLQEAEDAKWTRAHGQIQIGAITINEWREEQGFDPVPWGDAWWAPFTVAPVSKGGAAPAPAETEPEEQPEGEEPERLAIQRRQIEFGSPEHDRLWGRFARRTDRQIEAFAALMRDLFERQRDSVVAKLKAKRSKRQDDADDLIKGVFVLAQWIKLFREAARPLLAGIIEQAGEEAIDDLGIGIDFDVANPAVIRFLEGRAQRFAKEVNETTWAQLKESLEQGIDEGDGIAELAERVEQIMAERIRSSAETIARTEVIGAANGGTLEGWEQSGVVEGKSWLAQLDGRQRDTHEDAHNRYQAEPIPLDEDFEVGFGKGPAPGQIGEPEEDINCRCTMTAALSERAILAVPARATGIPALAAGAVKIAVEKKQSNGKPRKVIQTVRYDDAGRISAVEEEEL